MTGKYTPLIVLLGPTAIGKTGLAIAMAQEVDGEVVGADSRQIYRYMDIGTAKPEKKERAIVRHHLIDIVEPDDNLSLAEYQQLAYTAIDDIHMRGRVPLLVGGTGQYLTAVTEGWSIPEVAPNLNLREELEQLAAEHGSEVLYRRLQQIDPAAAEKIHPHNVRRTIRAIEVFEETGKQFSDLQRKNPPPYTILELGLTMSRHKLYERADKRVNQMIEVGFVDEVRRLHKMGYNRNLPSMSGLGYAQLSAHIIDGIPLEQAIADTKIATHRFIRRQYTWFRGHDNGIEWYDLDQYDHQAIVNRAKHWLNEQS